MKFYVKAVTMIQSLKDESGQDLIEYSLLGALIAVACVVIMGTVGTQISTEFGKITAKLT
jgi:Flp pilus assembly pilin Flp